MRGYFVIIFIGCIINMASFGYAEDEMPFVYKDEGVRDPFVPLVTDEGKLVVNYGVIKSIADVNLEGIIYDPQGGSIIVLNNLMLKENDTVGRIKVKNIEKDRVTLLFADKEYIFKLKE